jgi:hypothetical protein
MPGLHGDHSMGSVGVFPLRSVRYHSPNQDSGGIGYKGRSIAGFLQACRNIGIPSHQMQLMGVRQISVEAWMKTFDSADSNVGF